MRDNRESTDKKELLNAELIKGEESGFIKDFEKDILMNNLRKKYLPKN